MRIFLIGFMGSGKSYIGKRLAKSLGVSFIDLDDYLEKKESRSIKKIFEEEGEDYFRRKEEECLLEMDQFENVIIATGGGAPCFFDNSDWMNKNGITVYLKTPLKIIYKRLIEGREKRPLVQSLSDQELKDFIQKKLEARTLYYENVHIVYERQEGDEAIKELANYFSMFQK